jgi:alpha-mannosidase
MRWTAQKIAQRLRVIAPLVYRRSATLPPLRYWPLASPMEAPPVGPEVSVDEWPVLQPHSYWGGWSTDFVLRTSFRVPPEWDPDAPVALYLPLGESGGFSHPEALAYIDGRAYATADRHHDEILLPPEYRDGRSHALALHGWTGPGDWEGRGLAEAKLMMGECAVVQLDPPTRDFIATARVALGVAATLDVDEPARGRLLSALDEAFVILDTREPFGNAFYATVAPAHAALRAGIEKAGPPLDVHVVASGHAHLDVAWLWTVDQIRRKSGRTFHTVMRLMEQFPDYHFTQSQPQLYDFVRQDYPELFAAIKQRVAEGRWEPIGGMWVEADCNLSGAESLARQFLLGRTFFREHFGAGADSPVLWLPDVFGYAWALPQLIKEAGLDYFFTIKIGWSQYNRLPYDTFWWQGLDGTRVLTHFSTTPEAGGFGVSTYNAMATPQQVIGTWTNFQQKELEDTLFMAYGFGDGGGGPTREMLENIREMAAFPATPQVRQGGGGEFFRALEAQCGDELPTWNGELYLELHRGTYTTQSRNKRANRLSEFRLHDAEFLASLAAVVAPAYTYPAENLRRAWELVCLNQFHDIIPGSSIGPVYVVSQEQYAQVREIAAQVQADALSAITGQVGIAPDTGREIWVINPTSFAQDELVYWPQALPERQGLRLSDGTPLPVQASGEGTWIGVGRVAAFGINRIVVTDGRIAAAPASLTATPTLLENDLLRVELNAAGDITRIYDKAHQREVLPPGAIANQFLAFEDRPMQWGAWDIDIFYDDKHWLSDPAVSVTVVEAGPLRATLEIRRRVLHSEYVQRISLAHHQARLDFDTHIDWRERHILLKVAFPVDILAPAATYEIQWGHVQRPTHRNTSWDWARFETCAQKWVDLSEGGYGVSLLNDCKYGHDIRDNVIRLSLLRGPVSPDPEADQGEHRFAYSLLPHAGGWEAGTPAAAYALNDPLIVHTPGGSGSVRAGGALPVSLIEADAPNIIIETVKRADDGNGLIVRFYESQRRRGPVTLTAGFAMAQAWRTNLLEEAQEALAIEGNRVRLYVHPHQIVTLRLVPARA